MNIGVLEIMPLGHYTLVNSIASIFTSQESGHVTIFTHAQSAEVLQPITKGKDKRITIISRGNEEPLQLFVDKIKSFQLDRVYIVTLEKYYREVFNTDFGCPVHLFIHNIDEWFQVTFKYRLYHLYSEFTFSPTYAFTLKRALMYPYWRKKILSKVLATGGKVVVLNSILKKELLRFVDEAKTEVLPFSVYDPSLRDLSVGNAKLRFCIPGLLSIVRRDYFSIFSIIEHHLDFFKKRIELDLLGGISLSEQGNQIIDAAEKLIAKGVTIHLHKTAYIPMDEFDMRLAMADIVLGNLNLELDKFSSYGKTKETGIPFTMIRAAKPGLMIAEFPLLAELTTSTIFFKDYDELGRIMIELAENPQKVAALKVEAKKNSLLFDPAYIYQQLSSF